MSLKAKKPEQKEKRLKMFLFGEAGIGKTLASLQFPNAYVVDCEKGTDFYANTINKANSVVLQTFNSDEIYAEVRELLTTKHNYRTLIIDPITQVYHNIQEKWTKRFIGSLKESERENNLQDFGMRYWGKVKGEFKALQRLILVLDMNVIITAHQKDVYGENFKKMGVTFDSMKGDDYFFDYVFRLVKRGKERMAEKVKERAEIGGEKFPAEFIWSYDSFLKYYGKDIIEKASVPVPMATPEDVEKIKELVATIKVDDKTLHSWFLKANVDSWGQMSKAQITKCIDFVEKKLNSVKKDKPKPKKKGE